MHLSSHSDQLELRASLIHGEVFRSYVFPVIAGAAYREMVQNILHPIINNPDVTFVRYDVHHSFSAHTADALIGRAAHIAVLDSEKFLEKFLMVVGLKYFR